MLLGKQAIDDDANQTGQMLATLWGRPQATFAGKLEVADGKATVTREVDAGLETIEYQLSAIDSIPYDQQAQMLIESLRDKKKGADQLKLMVEMYTLQEIERMYSELGEDAAGSEEFEQILLTNRNKNWIPIIANMASEKPTLFAVGAGHLGGPQGVITLLKNQGYTLTPLSQVKN